MYAFLKAPAESLRRGSCHTCGSHYAGRVDKKLAPGSGTPWFARVRVRVAWDLGTSTALLRRRANANATKASRYRLEVPRESVGKWPMTIAIVRYLGGNRSLYPTFGRDGPLGSSPEGTYVAGIWALQGVSVGLWRTVSWGTAVGEIGSLAGALCPWIGACRGWG